MGRYNEFSSWGGGQRGRERTVSEAKDRPGTNVEPGGPPNVRDEAAATAKPPKGTPEGDVWRYRRYVDGGGQLPYEEWFQHSRGGRSGGPGHQKIQERLKQQGLDTEVPFGNRAADPVVNPHLQPNWGPVGNRQP